jgi:hypothetical protein
MHRDRTALLHSLGLVLPWLVFALGSFLPLGVSPFAGFFFVARLLLDARLLPSPYSYD